MSLKVKNVKPISQIRQEQLVDDKARIAQLENELAASKEETLMVMEALAEVYEELLALKGEAS
ncbi:hypothetical protein [Brevibacillus sp. SAFN-007a]|uniref:hypothetical protein n=1 Tax=Brevibacillus sp. SAFN-007a TaxID=3436862 RepID=UPI003F81B63C